MVSATGVHHHRSTTKSSHKPFKSRHATKSSLKTQNKGKVEDPDTTHRKNPHQQMLSKINRRNKARQLQQNKHQELIRDFKVFDGRRGAPRIVAVVPLCEDGDAAAAVRAMKASLDIEGEVPAVGIFTTGIERFKQKIQWIVLKRDLLAVMDACKIADFVVFILSANQEVDAAGELIIRSVEAQGISNTVTVVQHLETVEPAKQRPEIKKSLLSFISHFFNSTAKVHSLESAQDALNVIRSLCTMHPKGVQWRDSRSYLLAEEVRWDENNGLVIGGVVRGKGLKADRLVHIQGYGDFQVDKICAYPTENAKPADADAMAVDNTASPQPLQVLETPTENQDDLLELAPEEEIMQDIEDAISEAPTNMTESRRGVLLDDHHYFDDEIDEINQPYEAPRKLPKGTSAYQAAWILDDDSEYSDVEDEDDVDMRTEDEPARPEDGPEGRAGPAMTEAGTEYGDDAKSEMFLDPSPEQEAQQIQSYRNRQAELDEEREFPDEIELHPNVLARERLSRYRGLKSLRSSPWDTEEDRPFQPEHWDRLARIEDYKGMKYKILREALVGGVPPGTKVLLFLRNGNQEIANSFSPAKPFPVFSLLKHEHKQAVVNVSLTPSTEYEGEPIKAKDELILQVGPRRLVVKPLFSQGGATGKNNVTKFERFLITGRASVATMVAPILWGNVPAVFLKRGDDGELELVGQGSFLSVDRERVVAKRIVLTGHPYKIHKKLVTVRYMFFNAEDVAWFKAIPLFTKRGRSGFIKESLGTHGYFKATFDGKINPQDAVAISLYKRVFPRGSVEYRA
ncbi:ribosome biogenesis protein tsr1 [Rhizina undulata]